MKNITKLFEAVNTASLKSARKSAFVKFQPYIPQFLEYLKKQGGGIGETKIDGQIYISRQNGGSLDADFMHYWVFCQDIKIDFTEEEKKVFPFYIETLQSLEGNPLKIWASFTILLYETRYFELAPHQKKLAVVFEKTNKKIIFPINPEQVEELEAIKVGSAASGSSFLTWFCGSMSNLKQMEIKNYDNKKSDKEFNISKIKCEKIICNDYQLHLVCSSTQEVYVNIGNGGYFDYSLIKISDCKKLVVTGGKLLMQTPPNFTLQPNLKIEAIECKIGPQYNFPDDDYKPFNLPEYINLLQELYNPEKIKAKIVFEKFSIKDEQLNKLIEDEDASKITSYVTKFKYRLEDTGADKSQLKFEVKTSKKEISTLIHDYLLGKMNEKRFEAELEDIIY